MKIAYFIHCYPPAKGGLEYLSGEIVDILRKAGHEVHVFTGKGETLDSYKTFDNWVDESQDTDYIHRLPLRFFWQRLANKFLNKLIFVTGFFSPWYFGPILKYSDEVTELIQQADLIIGAGMPTKMFYDAYSFAKKFSKPLIVHPSYHDVSYYNRSLFFQKVLGYAKKVILQTPLEKEKILSNYRIDKQKIIHLTYSPFTLQQVDAIEKQLSKRAEKILERWQEKEIRIGFVGQISPRKNLVFFQNFLLQFQFQLQKAGYRLNIHLAGAKTNASNVIESMFKGQNDTVNIEYNFSNKDTVYEKLDLFVNPSYEESLGIVNFEAIYYGCIVFLHDKSAFYSLLQLSDSSEQQSLFTLDQLNVLNLHNLMNNKNLMKTMKNQWMLLKTYNANSYQEKLLSLIEK